MDDKKTRSTPIGTTRVVVTKRSDAKSSVFSDITTPGVGRVKVMNREVFEKASRSAGTAMSKAVIGKPWNRNR